jgi:hypothetical protein
MASKMTWMDRTTLSWIIARQEARSLRNAYRKLKYVFLSKNHQDQPSARTSAESLICMISFGFRWITADVLFKVVDLPVVKPHAQHTLSDRLKMSYLIHFDLFQPSQQKYIMLRTICTRTQQQYLHRFRTPLLRFLLLSNLRVNLF